MKILLIEDNKLTATVLKTALMGQKYAVEIVADGEIGLQLAETEKYDLILLDVELPKVNGITLCRQLRQQGHKTPILMLTAKDKSQDRVIGLEAGADDYVVKPYDMPELIARIRSLLRRAKSHLPTVLSWENLQLNSETKEVRYGDKIVRLTRKQYKILQLFLENPQHMLSRSQILDKICSAEEFPGEEAVTNQIKDLRQKLKSAGMTADMIETVYGLGYRLKPEPKHVLHNESQKTVESVVRTDENKSQANVWAVIAAMRKEFEQEELPEQLMLFQKVLIALLSDSLDVELKLQAQASAHELVGSLGSFGLTDASQRARVVEKLLETETQKSQADTAQKLSELIEALKQIKLEGPTETTLTTISKLSSLFKTIIISENLTQAKQIEMEAVAFGLQVEVATSLAAAREAMAQNVPELVLIDLQDSRLLQEVGDLSQLTDETQQGVTFLTELKIKHPQTQVVVMSASVQLKQRVEFARLGGFTFLQKPFSKEQLHLAINRTLKLTPDKKAKVMAVDDDTYVLASLRHLLSPQGIEVITLSNPQKFWEVLEVTTPDLLILDLIMPGFNGIELCQTVRNDLRWVGLPILFLSANRDAQTVQQAFSAGADDFLHKPILESELINRVLNRLKRTVTNDTLTNDK
ncbi:response regulator [Scytonema sp. UIC 10036]|uniref:response regulator n=1 Tax=Scytonema sp. UIC 10036 TaxID=2304196 RepID=UPI0012DA8B00|nr:response regulator [Scytonema sp. UIC 10036]MUG99885.1 response regulator [Scytonema sp. UIC 10036]